MNESRVKQPVVRELMLAADRAEIERRRERYSSLPGLARAAVRAEVRFIERHGRSW